MSASNLSAAVDSNTTRLVEWTVALDLPLLLHTRHSDHIWNCTGTTELAVLRFNPDQFTASYNIDLYYSHCMLTLIGNLTCIQALYVQAQAKYLLDSASSVGRTRNPQGSSLTSWCSKTSPARPLSVVVPRARPHPPPDQQ